MFPFLFVLTSIWIGHDCALASNGELIKKFCFSWSRGLVNLNNWCCYQTMLVKNWLCFLPKKYAYSNLDRARYYDRRGSLVPKQDRDNPG